VELRSQGAEVAGDAVVLAALGLERRPDGGDLTLVPFAFLLLAPPPAC
jgi:hypothetical protein